MGSQTGADGLTSEALEARRSREFPYDQSSHLGLRLRRGISWSQRAEEEADDEDAAFIFYWIAFNALYAQESSDTLDVTERDAMRTYFHTVAPLDTNRAVYDAIWERFSGSIRLFIDNRFVFQPFWSSRNRAADQPDWEQDFERSKNTVGRALVANDTAEVLWQLFGRLYVLRNQLLHGGATWRSSVNRDQVRDGKRIMEFLTPRFIQLMMDNPNVDWGVARYPPVVS